MKKLKVYTLTFLLSAFTLAPGTRVNAAPPLNFQVSQLANWFTGLFNNSAQVASNSTVPLITISSCSVNLDNSGFLGDAENVYFEQESQGFERLRLYSFSQGNNGVNLSIRSFLNPNPLRGLCNSPQPVRTIPVSNLPSTSCNLEVFWQPNDYYQGTNAPVGCPTFAGGKVVSTITVRENTIDSLDQIFNSQGQLLVGTPIEFRRVYPIPEPSLNLGLVIFGIWGTKKFISSIVQQKSRRKITASA